VHVENVQDKFVSRAAFLFFFRAEAAVKMRHFEKSKDLITSAASA
jgi:hypothetical protein